MNIEQKIELMVQSNMQVIEALDLMNQGLTKQNKLIAELINAIKNLNNEMP